jgi:hypothetical protein
MKCLPTLILSLSFVFQFIDELTETLRLIPFHFVFVAKIKEKRSHFR